MSDVRTGSADASERRAPDVAALLADLRQRIERGVPQPLPEGGARFASLADHAEAEQLLLQTVSSTEPAQYAQLRAIGFPLPTGAAALPFLHVAMHAGRFEIVDELLAAGIPLDQPLYGGQIPLQWVLVAPPSRRALAMAERLIAGGSPLSARDERGYSLRACARSRGYEALLDRLPPEAGEVPVDPEARDVERVDIELGIEGRERHRCIYTPNDPQLPLAFDVAGPRDEGWRCHYAAPGAEVSGARPWSGLAAELRGRGLVWMLPFAQSWERGAPLGFGKFEGLLREALPGDGFAIHTFDRSRP